VWDAVGTVRNLLHSQCNHPNRPSHPIATLLFGWLPWLLVDSSLFQQLHFFPSAHVTYVQCTLECSLASLNAATGHDENQSTTLWRPGSVDAVRPVADYSTSCPVRVQMSRLAICMIPYNPLPPPFRWTFFVDVRVTRWGHVTW
jgi:hypothetical protein